MSPYLEKEFPENLHSTESILQHLFHQDLKKIADTSLEDTQLLEL